ALAGCASVGVAATATHPPQTSSIAVCRSFEAVLRSMAPSSGSFDRAPVRSRLLPGPWPSTMNATRAAVAAGRDVVHYARLDRSPATVDGKGRSGHQGRGVGGEEHDRAHEILDLAHAPERDAGQRSGTELGIGEERRGHRRAHEGRAERVD